MNSKLINMLKNEFIIVTILIVLFLGLVGLSINKVSIWHDESYTATLIESNYTEIIQRTAKDVHPPLYYLMLKVWSNVFGDKILTLRLFSTVTMLGAIVATWWLIRKQYGRRTAAFALLLMSIAPFLVRYGQEMRMYGLAALWASLATILYSYSIGKKKLKVSLSLAYGTIIALGFLTQYFFVLVPIAHFIHVIITSRKSKTGIVKSIKPYVVSVIIAVLIVIPWLPTIYKQYTDVYGAFWIGKVGVETLTSTPVAMTVFLKQYEMTGLLGALGVITLGLIFYLVRRVFTQHRDLFTKLLLVSVISPPVVLFILSTPPFQPSYQDRYMSFFAPIFYSVLAIGVVSLKSGYKKKLAAGLMIGILMTGQFFQYRDGNSHGWSPKPHFTMKEITSKVNTNGEYPVYSTSLWTFFDAHITFQDIEYSGPVKMLVESYPTGTNGNWSAVYGRNDLFTTEINENDTVFWLIDESQPKYNGSALSNYEEVETYKYGYATLSKYIKK